jgi:hypothetical protein
LKEKGSLGFTLDLLRQRSKALVHLSGPLLDEEACQLIEKPEKLASLCCSPPVERLSSPPRRKSE